MPRELAAALSSQAMPAGDPRPGEPWGQPSRGHWYQPGFQHGYQVGPSDWHRSVQRPPRPVPVAVQVMGIFAVVMIFCCGLLLVRNKMQHLSVAPPAAGPLPLPTTQPPYTWGDVAYTTPAPPQWQLQSTSPFRGVQVERCPGRIQVAGLGAVSLINAERNKPDDAAGVALVYDGTVMAYMRSRTYFGTGCTSGTGPYNVAEYQALKLLGKQLRYTTDVSGVGCGCNAAFYLTSMAQNSEPSQCYDHYCDAMHVCGVSCAEIDVQEASSVAWHSTLHTSSDEGGKGTGFGGTMTDFSAAEYGPSGRCINTMLPFQVTVSFPPGLPEMRVELSQSDMPCTVMASVRDYSGNPELAEALSKGMTPIMSYWSSPDMQWFDGGGQGPCSVDAPQQCGEYARFYDFSISDIVAAA